MTIAWGFLSSTVLPLAKRQVLPSHAHAGRICLASQQLISTAGRRAAWSLADSMPASLTWISYWSVRRRVTRVTPVSPAARSQRQRRAQSPATGFMNDSVRDLSYLCRLRCHTLGSRPNGPSQAFLYDSPGGQDEKFSPRRRRYDIMDTDDGWGVGPSPVSVMVVLSHFGNIYWSNGCDGSWPQGHILYDNTAKVGFFFHLGSFA